MAIPQEIKDVPRPKGTIIKYSFGRYFVIKRTSKRVPGKKTPRTVDLGTIGEIVDGQYVEIRKEPKKVTEGKSINIKSYGPFAVCHMVGKSLLKDLKLVFNETDANKLYAIAILRVCEPDIRNRDIKLAYDTSYLSEVVPGIALSENTISTFLRDTGMEYLSIQNFLKARAKKFASGTQILDSTLKDNNSDTNSFSEFSRKGRVKGSKDLALMYSYDLESKEPVLMKTYSGNVLDVRSLNDFIGEFEVQKGILVMDKGFGSKANTDLIRSIKGLRFILPLKRSSSLLKKHKMYDDICTSITIDDMELTYKKVAVDDRTFLYSFRDPIIAAEEEVVYLKKHDALDPDDYGQAKKEFGVISFETNDDMEPSQVYEAYASRWEIETMFKMFKEILDLDTENVHSDYSVITSEFINYLSVIIAQRLKNLFIKTPLKEKKNKKKEVVSTTSVSENYTFKQTMRYLSKIKMVRVGNKKWVSNYPANVKYIEELANALKLVV